MRKFLFFLIIPALISCNSFQSYDDGTNGSSKINAGVFSDDGTTAFVASFYNDDAPVISKNLKEKSSENATVSSATDKSTTNIKVDKVSSDTKTDKVKVDKDDKPEIKIVSTKENDKSSKDKVVVKDDSVDKTKKKDKNKISKDIPLFFYPIENVVIKKDFSSGNSKNSGLDFTVGSSEKIFASAAGIVIFAGEKNSLGKSVFVYHDKGYISIYYNLTTISVAKGSSVASADTVIGTASDSFHFEIRQQSSLGIEVLNPKNILQKRRK